MKKKLLNIGFFTTGFSVVSLVLGASILLAISCLYITKWIVDVIWRLFF